MAVDFRGLVARQSPHIIDGQAGRPVGLERQRGEPVQGHEGEEAGVVDGVLVPGNRGWGGEKARGRCEKRPSRLGAPGPEPPLHRVGER